MQKIFEKLKLYSPTVLRIGISLIILWFGSQQLQNPQAWTYNIPDYMTNFTGLNAGLIIILNGSFEIIFGTALLLGLQTRLCAFILTVHMFGIIGTVGYNPTGIRDLGLAFGLLAVFMHGASPFSLDALRKKSQ